MPEDDATLAIVPTSPTNSLHDFLLDEEESDHVSSAANSCPDSTLHYLRPRDLRGMQATTFIDEDDSGDYDPDCEPSCLLSARRQVQISRILPWAKQRAKKHDAAKRSSLQHCRRLERGKHLVLRISIRAWESQRGQAVMRLLKQSTQHRPDTEAGSDEANTNTNFTELQLTSIVSERLRQKHVPLTQHSRIQNSLQGLDPESLSWRDVTIGHPAARGCKACFEIGMICSLVIGDKYPCHHCRTETEDCNLIIEPTIKRACETCIRRRVACSFRKFPRQRGPCAQCDHKGFCCTVAPLSGHTRLGPSLDWLLRRVRVATKTRQSHNRLGRPDTRDTRSFGHEIGNEPPAVHSADSTLPYDPNNGSPWRHNPPSRSNITKANRSHYDDSVQFFFEAPDVGGAPCDWCEQSTNRSYHGVDRSVKVLHHTRGGKVLDNQNEDVRAAGEPSRMCINCTLLRIHIIGCPAHVLRILHTALGAATDEGTTSHGGFSDIVSNPQFGRCCVCPQVATYLCGGIARKLQSKDEAGCGLQLCTECARDLVISCNSDLSCLVTRRQWGAGGWSIGLRADAEFLKEDGQLAARYR